MPFSNLKLVIRVGSGVTLNNQKFYPMLRYASETDPTYEPYYIPLKDSKFDRAEQRVLGAKNLLKFPYYEGNKTQNGITFTVNNDGSITASGTATADTWFNMSQNPTFITQGGAYILSGCPSGGSSNTYCLRYTNNTDKSYEDTGNGVDVVGFASSYNNVQIHIRIKSGTAITTPITFYPMIRLASDPDDTYAPYSMTNRELTEVTETEASEVVSGATVVDIKILKNGNIVSLHFRLTGATVAAWGVLGVVPEGYRPKYTVTMRDTVGNKYVQIPSSGAITPSDALSSAAVSLFATWITA